MYKKRYTKKNHNRKTRKTRNKRRNIFGGTSSDGRSSMTLEKSTSPDTPRTNYSKAHLRGKPILLLNRAKPIEGLEPAILFQTTFDGPEQFKDYVNLSGNPRVDCFFQSVFALGLRSSRLAKKNAEGVNTEGKGVQYREMAKYLASSFGIPHELVDVKVSKEIRNEKGLYDRKQANILIKEFFNNYLENNHATIFGIDYPKGGDLADSHVLVAYKNKGTLFFFDPQQKSLRDDKYVISKTLAHLIKYNRVHVSKLRFFTVSGLDEPVQVLDVSCPVPYDM